MLIVLLKIPKRFIYLWIINLIKNSKDILIIGGGMVGLSIAHQINKSRPELSILIIDKENSLGKHSSGRNSGVLHAGIYYEPNTLKAKVCISGAKRLKSWCESQSLPVLSCGKVITPQKKSMDPQLDILFKRGKQNGAQVEYIQQDEFNKLVPDGKTASGRALWVKDTCVVKPREVINRLVELLLGRGIEILLSKEIKKFDPSNKTLWIAAKDVKQSSFDQISYGHLFNTSGLQADKIARSFNIANDLTILPFKGIYWQLHPKAPFNFTTNLYPVPDLKMPFLGVHVTPSPDGSVNLGPTAIPALGRENYKGLSGFELFNTIDFFGDIAYQWFKNTGGFRRYSYEQALHGLKPMFLRASKLLIPKLRSEHLIRSSKVGIRAQLYDKKAGRLIQDFKMENGIASTHILNAISPAFTASFSLADLILKKSNLSL